LWDLLYYLLGHTVLSNCDIKICTKAIAIRTSTVLDTIIGKTQAGYVPGRQVNDNNRLLEEIINLYGETRQKAYVITLDAQKAFDSVDHEYLAQCLKAFGFPQSYCDQVKTIYTDLKASILINGHISQSFNIEQSVKQGDALSCALFIIAIEPLLRKFNQDPRITPVILNPGKDNEESLISFSYADDITTLCQNKEGIQAVISIYEEFSKISGIKLNVAKTEIMVIGIENPPAERFRLLFNNQRITITTQESVKICGITFSNNKEVAYQSNIKEKILKMERQLNIWRQRNVSTEGKILLVKTFGLSQLIYSLQATNIKIEEEKKIEEIIYKFIWNLKPDSSSARGRIRRETLQCEKVDGGLKAPNIMTLNKAIKYKTLLRSMNIDHPVSTITNYILERKRFDFNHDSAVTKNRSSYIDMAITTHRELNQCIDKDLKSFYESNDNQMHRNYYLYMSNHNLSHSQYLNNNQRFP